MPLVSSGEANEVLSGNVTTSKGKMYMPNQAWLNLMSLLWPLEFVEDTGSRRFKNYSSKFAKGASGYDYRAYIYKELLPYKSVNDDTSEFSESQFICADYARMDQNPAHEAPAMPIVSCTLLLVMRPRVHSLVASTRRSSAT